MPEPKPIRASQAAHRALDWDIACAPQGEEEFSTEGVVTAAHVPSASAKTEKTRGISLFFDLTFDDPVTFPMTALGHSCHYGLGLFVAWNT